MQTIQRFFSWFVDTFRKQKTSGKVAIGCVSLFILCFLCSVPIAILNPSSTPTPTVASTSVVDVQSTPIATQTEKPTAVPTSTPILESTPTPDVTIDPYFVSLSEKLLEYAKAFLDVNEFVQQAGNDPSLILDSNWKTKLGLALGILNLRADELAELEPNPKYANIHSTLVKLADETHLFTDAFAKGVDNFDSALIEKAGQHLTNMATLVQEATTEIDRINKTKATP